LPQCGYCFLPQSFFSAAAWFQFGHGSVVFVLVAASFFVLVAVALFLSWLPWCGFCLGCRGVVFVLVATAWFLSWSLQCGFVLVAMVWFLSWLLWRGFCLGCCSVVFG